VRETELWRRLDRHLGSSYVRSWADQTALSAIGSRTVTEAIRDGVPFRQIWEAAWSVLELPASER